MTTVKTQILEQWQQAREQIEANTRLRVSLWFIALLIFVYPLLLLDGLNTDIHGNIERELEREARILRTASEQEWFQRAEQLNQVAQTIDAAFWKAPSPGIAKATLFQTLTDWAQQNELNNVQIRLEEPLAVSGQANIFRIAGQIDTAFDVTRSLKFLQQLEASSSKIVIEQMEISQRARPLHRLVIAAYFKVES
ncbi:hypothetical protein [Alteromonas flava]|uniref:hypothetical protein n=1 Tax=Alteromonas flava TaxID=2048003 RepID=UPI000C28F007|nr:hypothetical protein [Alteromonas flava]